MYKDFYVFPAVFEQNEQSIGIYFPDFDGCVSGGNDIEEAIKNAKEVLSLHLYGMEQDNDELPLASAPHNINLNDNECIVMVDINYSLFREKMDKKSVDRMVTLPRYLNVAAKESGLNISQVLQEALRERLGL